MEKLNITRHNLKTFAFSLGSALSVIGTFILFKQGSGYPWFYSIAFVLFFFGFFIPTSLKPLYVIWMRIVYLLAWINTRIILFLVFYLLFTPISLVIKVLAKDLLDKKISKDSQSYWKPKEEKIFNPTDYEKQY